MPERTCHYPNCQSLAPYPAPKSPNNLREKIWFCLEHIRVYNKAWNFFANMSGAEILDFKNRAIAGERKTWSREAPGYKKYQAYVNHELLQEQAKSRTQAALPEHIKKALATLDLTYPCTLKEIKKQYRNLAKKHHPDVTKGHHNEFTRVKEAYEALAGFVTV